jgi:hypothetical protein
MEDEFFLETPQDINNKTIIKQNIFFIENIIYKFIHNYGRNLISLATPSVPNSLLADLVSLNTFLCAIPCAPSRPGISASIYPTLV